MKQYVASGYISKPVALPPFAPGKVVADVSELTLRDPSLPEAPPSLQRFWPILRFLVAFKSQSALGALHIRGTYPELERYHAAFQKGATAIDSARAAEDKDADAADRLRAYIAFCAVHIQAADKSVEGAPELLFDVSDDTDQH
eukprot:6211465-Pleurochrysis_carterae.AAC.3